MAEASKLKGQPAGRRPLAWWLSLQTPGAEADEAGARLASLPGCMGVEVLGPAPGGGALSDGGGPPRDAVEIRAYFRSREAAAGARRRVAAGRVGVVAAGQAQQWLAAWRRTLRPVRVGEIEVRPVARLPASTGPARRAGGAATGRVRLFLRPGMAFGTGHHPTTRQALWALQWTGRGRSAVDVGTGSGILAVAAALWGFERVLAVDVDPWAVAEARAHVGAHGLGRRVRVRAGSAGTALQHWGRGCAELVMANLTVPALVELARELAALLAPGGRLVAAGVPRDGVEDVVASWQAQGLQPELVGEWGAWAWLEAVRAE